MVEEGSEISKLLVEGWVIVGYSTAMLALGGIAHSILLQKEDQVTTVTILVMQGKETGRSATLLAPYVEPKKSGFWS
jgi:hypothetical protein